MDIFTFILCVFYGAVGFSLIAGEFSPFKRLHIETIFGISNRWGKMLFGVMLLVFVGKQIHVWYLDPNTSLEIYFGPLKMYYEGFKWF